MGKLTALIGDRAGDEAVAAALDDLRERALVWGDSEVRVAAEASAGLPWYPGQAVLEGADLAADEIADRLAAIDDPQRELLRRLMEGSPMGRTRDAAPGTPPDRPVQRLLAAGLLRQVDAETVILPRLVGQVLRGELPGPVALTAPDPVVSTTTAADVDAVAAGAVIDLLREVDVRPRNPRRHTGSRTSQRRPRRPRRQAADQADRHRRTAAGTDPRTRRRRPG